MVHIYIAIGLAVIAVIIFIIGRKQGVKTSGYNLYVDATRASEVGAGVPVFYGGIVVITEGQVALTSPYSKQPCVWYDYVIEQEEMRRDSNGTETPEWQIVSQPSASGVRFQLSAEATGQTDTVFVDPSNANVDRPQQYEQLIQPMTTPAGGAAGVVGTLLNVASALGDHKTRVRERYIAVGQHLYAGGVCTEVQGQKLFANDGHYPLVLTPQSKNDLVKAGQRTSLIEYCIAVALGIGAICAFLLLKK